MRVGEYEGELVSLPGLVSLLVTFDLANTSDLDANVVFELLLQFGPVAEDVEENFEVNEEGCQEHS